jgi:hypothetical protein
MDIYTPNNYRGPRVAFDPSLEVQDLSLDDLSNFADEVVAIEDKKLNTIKTNYDTILQAQDEVTGINLSSAYGRKVLEQKKDSLGINEDLYNISLDDLKNPFATRRVQSTLNKLVTDPEVATLVQEEKIFQDYNRKVKQIERKDPGMANVFMNDLNQIATDSSGSLSVMDIDPNDYQRIDFTELISEELNSLPDTYEIRPNDLGNGYIIFDKVSNKKISEEDFAEMVAEKYSDSPLVQNNFRSQIDTNKPEGERSIEDPDAIGNYLREEARKAFQGSVNLVVSSEVRGRGNTGRSSSSKPSTTTPAKTGVDFKKERDQFGIPEEGAIAQLQIHQSGLPMNAETLKIVRDASNSVDGTIPPDVMQGLIEKYRPAPTEQVSTSSVPVSKSPVNTTSDNVPIKIGDQDFIMRGGYSVAESNVLNRESGGGANLVNANDEGKPSIGNHQFNGQLGKNFLEEYYPGEFSDIDMSKPLTEEQASDLEARLSAKPDLQQNSSEFWRREKVVPALNAYQEIFGSEPSEEDLIILESMATTTGLAGNKQVFREAKKLMDEGMPSAEALTEARINYVGGEYRKGGNKGVPFVTDMEASRKRYTEELELVSQYGKIFEEMGPDMKGVPVAPANPVSGTGQDDAPDLDWFATPGGTEVSEVNTSTTSGPTEVLSQSSMREVPAEVALDDSFELQISEIEDEYSRIESSIEELPFESDRVAAKRELEDLDIRKAQLKVVQGIREDYKDSPDQGNKVVAELEKRAVEDKKTQEQALEVSNKVMTKVRENVAKSSIEKLVKNPGTTHITPTGKVEVSSDGNSFKVHTNEGVEVMSKDQYEAYILDESVELNLSRKDFNDSGFMEAYNDLSPSGRTYLKKYLDYPG